jgi:hypothetical protein
MVVTRAKRTLLFLLALTAAWPAAFAQTSGSSIQPERRLLLFFSVRSGAALSGEEQRLLYESLLLRLSTAGAGFVVLETQEGSVPESERGRTETALEQGADAWIWVEVLSGLGAFRYNFSSYDLLTRKKTIETQLGKETPVRLRDLQRRLWEQAAGLLGEAYRQIEYGTEVTFKAAPGTSIGGLKEQPLEVGESGVLTVTLPNPSLYSYRATCRGYYPVHGRFNLKDQPLEFALQQERADRWVLDAGLNTMNFFSFAAGVFLLPNYLFLKLGITPYLAGLYFSGSEASYLDSTIFYSAPLTLVLLQAGYYLNAEDARLRIYAGAGVGLRLLHSAEYWGLDPLSPVALQLTAGLEIPLYRSIRGYFEYAPLAYLTGEPELLRASFPAGQKAFNFFFLSWVGVDFLNYRLGVRFLL